MHKYTEQEPFMYKNEEILSISVRSFREKQALLQPESAWIKQEILENTILLFLFSAKAAVSGCFGT